MDVLHGGSFVDKKMFLTSVADPGSVIRCFFDTWIRGPNRFFPDPGSWIPNPYFSELSDNLFGKKYYDSW